MAKKILLMVIAALPAALATAFAQDDDVRVEFIDSATKAVFAVSYIPPAKLPDKFAVNSTLNIKGANWSVVSADPPAKADFVKTGKLTLVLSKAEQAYPMKAVAPVFAKPTISGRIGRLAGDTPARPDVFYIREADWRQVEFVSTGFEKEIDDEFAGIHKVRAASAKDNAFSDIYVRSQIPAPVSNCTLREVQELIPQAAKFQAVGFAGRPGTLPHSFAWAADSGLVFWGIAGDDGNIILLCVAGAPRKERLASASDALSKLTSRYDLYLVDWCRETRLHGEVPDFEKYFGGQ